MQEVPAEQSSDPFAPYALNVERRVLAARPAHVPEDQWRNVAKVVGERQALELKLRAVLAIAKSYGLEARIVDGAIDVSAAGYTVDIILRDANQEMSHVIRKPLLKAYLPEPAFRTNG